MRAEDLPRWLRSGVVEPLFIVYLDLDLDLKEDFFGVCLLDNLNGDRKGIFFYFGSDGF